MLDSQSIRSFTSLLTQKPCTAQLLSLHMISTFKRIRILDATVFQLPDSFATDYQGSGGSSNTAGVKIQLVEVFEGGTIKIHFNFKNPNSIKRAQDLLLPL